MMLVVRLAGRSASFVLSLMETQLASFGLGKTPHSHAEKQFQSALLSYAVRFGHQPTIDAALALYDGELAGAQRVSPDIKSVVYKAAVRWLVRGSWQPTDRYWRG